MGDVNTAMDFFHGLDSARYAGFKTEILNGLTAKSITQPANLDAMYLLANQWVKPVTRGNTMGFASTFHTTLKQQPSQDKKEGGDRKDTIEYFACSEMGHYATNVRRGRKQKIMKMKTTTEVHTSRGM